MMTTTPKQEGYFFPAEWAPHRATWLSWPHKEASWPGKLEAVYGPYCRFIKEISIGEEVCINVVGPAMEAAASQRLAEAGVDLEKVRFFHHPTDDAWCRDHGPAFLVNRREGVGNAVVDWGYNAWGNKYPPYDQDDVIPTRVAEALGLPVFHPGIVMEGGAVDFNGQGAVLTTTSCLLNKNRNPQLTQAEIEHYLME